MSTLTKDKFYAAKTASHVFTLKNIRRWLIDNCKNRWTATDYHGNDFNWRKLSKIKPAKYVDKSRVAAANHSYDDMSYITIIINFKKPEDLMLYLLTWPSEVLLNE